MARPHPGYRRPPAVGTRVEFCPGPASFVLYGNPPPSGRAGTVVKMPGMPGVGQYLKGPGGGLLYVRWDGFGTMGVSLFDVGPLGKTGCVEGEKFVALEGDEDAPWSSLNYGELPDRKLFMQHYERALGTKLYEMELVAKDYDAIEECLLVVERKFAGKHDPFKEFNAPHGKHGFKFTLPGLYALVDCIVEQYEEADVMSDEERGYGSTKEKKEALHAAEEAMDLASSILQTLNIEWV